MAFGRRKKDQQPADQAQAKPGDAVEDVGSASAGPTSDPAPAVRAAQSQPAESDDSDEGPFDIEDFDNPEDALVARLDLGSVLIPMPAGGQVQVELSQNGVPSAIWVVTPNGRFTIAAYAAPKSAGQWREVAGELAEALRKDNASVSIQDGRWGREVVGSGAGVVRFIGIDGYRWMIRCVVNGNPDSMEALAAEAREALSDTVVRRGETPMPARTPLPVQLPEQLAAQLRAAAAQQAQQAQQAILAAQQAQQAQQAMLAAQQALLAQQQQQAERSPAPSEPRDADERRSAAGSAMQQLRGTGSGG
ncbi:MAG: hypothetical protein QG655_1376 [Actinomycetota bacterium]|nr:hypothetical protein [Actinomycetota bacterium]HPY24446.1 DUF3710 domain-containing protein [Mycobacterium sp.]